MPGFITHLCFGQQAASQINSDGIKNTINNHFTAFGLGLEGPDIFFYYLPAYFFRKNIGNVMHNERVLLFFEALIDERNNFSQDSDKEIADAYIMGFMGHYTLDTWCHPYIYCKTNHFEALNSRGKFYDFGNHVSLETDIDHLILEKYKGLTPTQFDYAAAILPAPHEIEIIAILLSNAINSVFPNNKVKVSRAKKVIYNFAKLNRAMRDPHGSKKSIIDRIEHLFLGCSFISSMIPSDTILKNQDPCNQNHESWYNPWNESATSNDSIIDLIEKATPNYINKINLYNECNRNISDEHMYYTLRNKLTTAIGDLSYLNGLPL